tara:strand:+ start:120 stop:719 length:600 start_codon:yes stop_codon:yes gene_type:complete
MSTLELKELSHPAGEVIKIAAGKTLDLNSQGTLVLPTVPHAKMPSGSVLQVVSTTKTDVFNTTSTSFIDVTGLSASITPSSTSSKILVTVFFNLAISSGWMAMALLRRDSTAICLGDASASRQRATAIHKGITNNNVSEFLSVTFLDSPSTTSATVYKLQIKSENSGHNVYMGRTPEDANNATYGARYPSTITVQEIQG